MLLNVLEVANVAAAVAVPAMEKRGRRKRFAAAVKAHQDSEGQFDYVPTATSSFDAQAFRNETDARQKEIDALQKKLGIK